MLFSCRGNEEDSNSTSPKKRCRSVTQSYISALDIKVRMRDGRGFDVLFSQQWRCVGHSLKSISSARPSALALDRPRALPTERLKLPHHHVYNPKDSALDVSEALSEFRIASQRDTDTVILVASPDDSENCSQIWAAILDGESESPPTFNPLFR